MNSPSTSVVVAGAVRSAARLVVMLFAVVRAHVKDGVQTACRHNLSFAHFWCITEHSLPAVEMWHYQPMMEHRWRQKEFSGSGLVRMSAI